MIKERRKHPRLRIPLEAEYLVAGEEEWRQGTIWTLGAGGAALLCEQKLAHGTVLEGVHFVVEAEGDLPETRIEVSAEVVSIDRKADFGRTSNFMLGLRFTGLGEQEFEILKQFVFRRLTNPNGASATDQDDPAEKAAAPPLEIRFKLFDEFVEEVSENLSPSGMFIRAHRPLPPGSRFVFQFQLGEDFSLFQGTAEVVWTRRRREGPDRPSGMGVRFLKLDLTSQKMVKRLVGERETEVEDGVGEAVEKPQRKKKATLELPADAEPFPIAALSEADESPAVAEDPAVQERTSERLEGLAKRLGYMESARDEAEERVLRIAAKAEELREEVRTLQSSRDESEEARRRTEAEAAEVEEARGHAEAQVAEAEEARSHAEAQVAEAEEARSHAEARVAEAEEARSHAEAQVAEAEEARSDAEAQIAESEEARRRAEAEAAESEEARSRAETEAAELQRELETLKPDDQLEEKLRRAREELESGREEWQSLEAELRADLGRGADSRSELQKELEAAGETEAELRRSLESASETEAELRAELRQMEEGRDDLERLAEKATEAEDRLQLMRQELADSRREWDATEAELRAQLDQHRAEKSDLEDRITETAGAEADLRQRLSEVRGARDELAERLAQGVEVEAVLREQAQEFRLGRDESVAKLARATEQLDRVRGAAEEMKSRFNGDLSAAQELGVDLATKLAEVAEVGSGLDRKVESLSAARADLAERLSRINEAWSSLEGGLEAVEAEEGDPEVERVEPLMFASTPSAGEEAEALDEVESDPEPVEESSSLAAAEQEVSPEDVPDVAAEGEPDLTPQLLAAEEEMPVDEPVETPVSVPAEHPAEAAELAESTAVLESDEEPAAMEEEPPAPTGAARLVGVARRAVARLGFARKSTQDVYGGWLESESEVPILEAKTDAVVADDEPSPVVIEEPSPVAIEDTVKAWAAAWSERRVEDYLAFYSQEFEPVQPDDEEETGEAPHAWLPPLTGMQLTLGPISQTEVSPGRFTVQFEQSVESDSYTRRAGRTLEMVLEADAWKIAAESFQDLPS